MSFSARLTKQIAESTVRFRLILTDCGRIELTDGTQALEFPVVRSVADRALSANPGLLAEDPQTIGEQIDRHVAEATAELSGNSLALYWAGQAQPGATSPMEYGGFFLERDREVLEAAKDTAVILTVPGEEAYIDFVSDLPAVLLAVDVKDLSSIRPLTQTPIAARSDDADVTLEFSLSEIDKNLIAHV